MAVFLTLSSKSTFERSNFKPPSWIPDWVKILSRHTSHHHQLPTSFTRTLIKWKGNFIVCSTCKLANIVEMRQIWCNNLIRKKRTYLRGSSHSLFIWFVSFKHRKTTYFDEFTHDIFLWNQPISSLPQKKSTNVESTCINFTLKEE